MQSNDFSTKEVIAWRDARRDGEALKTLRVIQPRDTPVRPIESIFPDLEPFETSHGGLKGRRNSFVSKPIVSHVAERDQCPVSLTQPYTP